MTQSVDEKKEVSDFNDVEHAELRNYNRGAVLANIYEGYVVNGTIPAKDIKLWLYDVSAYLSRIPDFEVQAAKDMMKVHLEKRGWTI